jgi:hypothetical protein
MGLTPMGQTHLIFSPFLIVLPRNLAASQSD